MGKGRAPCCAKVGLNKGTWTPEEDMRLIAYIRKYGHANWRALPKQAGLLRCGKSCRLRWINYLSPDLKRGNFTAEEEETLIKLHSTLGNKIAACLPGRTDNEIKNVWNTHLKKRVAASAGEQKKTGGDKSKKKKNTRVEAPVPSASPSSSTTTTNCSSADSAEQSNRSKEETELDKIEIPTLDFGFDLDMLLEAVPDTHFPAMSAPTSPCSSASPPCVVDDDGLLDLPEIDIVPELWSIMDGDGGTGACVEAAQAPWSNAAPSHGDGTEACASTADDGKEWWLEDLERELGLWGPIEDYQYQALSGLVGPPSASVDDPVTCYLEAGPVAGTLSSLEVEPEASAVLTTDIQMDL